MELGDWLVASAFAMALVLNGILGIQLWMYWGKGGIYDAEDYELAEAGGEREKKEKISVYLGGGISKVMSAVNGNEIGGRTKGTLAPTRIRLGTPPQRSGLRKVD
jgi:mannose-P-dolichol utilization defect protein 1